MICLSIICVKTRNIYYNNDNIMKQIIGYVHIREVDGVRFDIYKDNDRIYWKFSDINLPTKYLNKRLEIVLTKTNDYNQYVNEVNQSNFPEYIYINGDKVKNTNILKYGLKL